MCISAFLNDLMRVESLMEEDGMRGRWRKGEEKGHQRSVLFRHNETERGKPRTKVRCGKTRAKGKGGLEQNKVEQNR